MIDCETLTGRLRDICLGTSGLPEFGPGNTREAYMAYLEGNPPPKAEPLRLECVYRGAEIDRISCPTCIPEKHVTFKVFACPLHRRCVLTAGTEERFCGTCESRLETAESSV